MLRLARTSTLLKRLQPSRTLVTMQQMEKYVQDPKVTVIDVRGDTELVIGTIQAKNFLHIPLPEIDAAFQMDPNVFRATYGHKMPEKDDEIVIYCKAGVRANTAVQIMKNYGFTEADFYGGSYDEWSQFHK